MAETAIYDRLISEVFRRHYRPELTEFLLEREEMETILREWGERVKNLGDVTYSYRGGRRLLPDEIRQTGQWVIEGRGRGKYAFRRLSRNPDITLPPDLRAIGILDATPDVILKYGSGDEQGLLTRVRYNRLIDTFLGVTAYHLQSHCRAYVTNSGQVEIDDLYLGVDTNGRQYVIPVEGKTVDEPMGVVQIVNMIAYAKQTFPDLALRPVAIKAWSDQSLFFVEFNDAVDANDIAVHEYRRYILIRDPHLTRSWSVSPKIRSGEDDIEP